MHFHKHHHSTPEEAEALAQKLLDKANLDNDPGTAKSIAKGVSVLHSRFSEPTTHAQRKESWKKELEEMKQRKRLQHEHSFHSAGSTTDLLAGSSAAAGSNLNENPSTQDDQLADNSGPRTSGITTAKDAQGDSESHTTAEEVADECVAVDCEEPSPAIDSPPPYQATPSSSSVSNGSVMIKTTSQICDMIRELEKEHFFDPKYIALLPEQLAKKLKEMGITCAGMLDEKSFGAGQVAEEGENGLEDEGYQEGEGDSKGSEP